MKKVSMILSALAIVFAVSAGLAGHTASNTAWFYVDGNENPVGDPLPGRPSNCISDPTVCAKEFEMDGQGQYTIPTGVEQEGLQP